MSILSLKYGNGVVTLNAKNPASLEKVVVPVPTPLTDVGRAFVDAASYQCVRTTGLNTLVSPQDLFTIVLRAQNPVPMSHIVSLTTYYLNSLGVPYENMAVLCLSNDTSVVPPDLVSRLTVVTQSYESGGFVSFGKTTQGIEVTAHPLLKGRKVIVIDCVRRDPLTGYSGGAACLAQAFSQKTLEACYAHAYVSGQISPSVQSGIVTGNPLCDAMTESARLLQPFFGIYAITDSAGQFARFICGNWLDAWYESCKIAQQQFALPLSGPADIVAASCGGYPYDDSLFSAYTSLCHAAQALNAPEGIIILAVEGRSGGPQELLENTAPANTREGVTSAALRALTKKYRILMQSKINTQSLAALGIEAFRTMETLEAKVDFSGKVIRFLPCAHEAAPYQA